MQLEVFKWCPTFFPVIFSPFSSGSSWWAKFWCWTALLSFLSWSLLNILCKNGFWSLWYVQGPTITAAVSVTSLWVAAGNGMWHQQDLLLTCAVLPLKPGLHCMTQGTTSQLFFGLILAKPHRLALCWEYFLSSRLSSVPLNPWS